MIINKRMDQQMLVNSYDGILHRRKQLLLEIISWVNLTDCMKKSDIKGDILYDFTQ